MFPRTLRGLSSFSFLPLLFLILLPKTRYIVVVLLPLVRRYAVGVRMSIQNKIKRKWKWKEKKRTKKVWREKWKAGGETISGVLLSTRGGCVGLKPNTT